MAFHGELEKPPVRPVWVEQGGAFQAGRGTLPACLPVMFPSLAQEAFGLSFGGWRG